MEGNVIGNTSWVWESENMKSMAAQINVEGLLCFLKQMSDTMKRSDHNEEPETEILILLII